MYSFKKFYIHRVVTKQSNMKVFITSILVFSCLFGYANDSALYNRRLQKIEQLHAWLSKRPYISIDIKNVDTNHISWRSYDTVVNTFFDRKYLDSLFASRVGSDDIFAPSAKYEILKLLISKFHELTQRQCFRELKFKKADLDNTIIQYFIHEGKELTWNAFTFADKGVRLVDMPIYGFSTEDLGQFMLIYEKLKPCDLKTQ